MRRILVVLALAALFGMTIPLVSADSNVVYTKRWVAGTVAHVVTVNLNSPNVIVTPAIARYGIGTSEGFGSMISRLRPAAAITGTYFCVQSLLPVGDLVVDGNLVYSGCVGTAVCFTPENKVEFLDIRDNEKPDWSPYASVIRSGPRLVRNGVVGVSARSEGFRSSMVSKISRRSAIGVTLNNKLLLVTVNRPVSIWTLAKAMRDLGCMEAIQLDGGSSSALYCKGHTYSHPARRMTNLFLVYDSPERYAAVKSRLAPSPIVAATSSKS